MLQLGFMEDTTFITDKEIYEQVILQAVFQAKKFVWMGTAAIKDLYVAKRKKMVPFLEILSDLINQGVLIRLIYAKQPGPAFKKDFKRYPNLKEGLERMLCPRAHLKSVIVDGDFAYTGSANLTGAGMGAKSSNRRNFEAGIITTNPLLVSRIMEQFDTIWIGNYCQACQRQEYCTEELS